MENIAGPRMYCHRPSISMRIESADVTAGMMKTHQAMDSRHFHEGRVDGAMRIGNWQALYAYAQERSQPGLSTLNGPVV